MIVTLLVQGEQVELFWSFRTDLSNVGFVALRICSGTKIVDHDIAIGCKPVKLVVKGQQIRVGGALYGVGKLTPTVLLTSAPRAKLLLDVPVCVTETVPPPPETIGTMSRTASSMAAKAVLLDGWLRIFATHIRRVMRLESSYRYSIREKRHV